MRDVTETHARFLLLCQHLSNSVGVLGKDIVTGEIYFASVEFYLSMAYFSVKYLGRWQMVQYLVKFDFKMSSETL